MKNPVKERIAKLREEIAQISEASKQYKEGSQKLPAAASDHERRVLCRAPGTIPPQLTFLPVLSLELLLL